MGFHIRHRLFSSVPGEIVDVPRVTTIAWVQSIRRHKTKIFLNVNDGTSPNNLQVRWGGFPPKIVGLVAGISYLSSSFKSSGNAVYIRTNNFSLC